jgi:hypothetical protein
MGVSVSVRKGGLAMANPSSLKCLWQFIPLGWRDVEAKYLLMGNGFYIGVYFS